MTKIASKAPFITYNSHILYKSIKCSNNIHVTKGFFSQIFVLCLLQILKIYRWSSLNFCKQINSCKTKVLKILQVLTIISFIPPFCKGFKVFTFFISKYLVLLIFSKNLTIALYIKSYHGSLCEWFYDIISHLRNFPSMSKVLK